MPQPYFDEQRVSLIRTHRTPPVHTRTERKLQWRIKNAPIGAPGDDAVVKRPIVAGRLGPGS